MRYLIVANIASAASALVVGLWAAYYWWKASTVEIDPGWRIGIPESAADARKPIEPGDLQLSNMGWTMASVKAASESANLNKVAARLTAVAVVLSGFSAIVGALAGYA